MAAIDPTAKPLKEDEPKRATLKLMRSPLDLDDFMDEDDEEPSDDDDGSDEESKKIGKLSKKLKEKHAEAANKRGRDNAMEVNGKDEDEGDSEDSEDDGEGDDGEYEEFVICTLDPEKVGL
jgi:FK506-binding nuclear protein